MTEYRLEGSVSIRKHFRRSINISEDATSEHAVRNYIVTPEVGELAEYIVGSINDSNRSRAWAITGPYGSGKSAFGLFLTDVLCMPEAIHFQTPMIRTRAGWDGRLRPVFVTGHRGSLVVALLAALSKAVEPLDAAVSRAIEGTAETITADRVWGLFDIAITTVKECGYAGLYVVVDEFGKFLEHAAANPESEDLVALQYLAEEGDRRPGEFLLITILHSAFADYLPAGNRVMRAEWQKIQGRFQDVAFTTSLNQHLTLLSSAIDARFPTELNELYNEHIDQAMAIEGLEAYASSDSTSAMLRRCAPMHPMAALLTWPIFRSKMAQNERSLFSFLSSYEYSGFVWFIGRAVWDAQGIPLYRLDDLYDYTVNALGSAVTFGEFSTGWAEIATALDRLDAMAPESAVAVVKTIGLLGLYGTAVGLDATPEVLRAAMGSADAVDEALAYLSKHKMILFRRYIGAYRLWEGSDLDLDELFDSAVNQVGEKSVAERLQHLVDLRPVVARRHYVATGTLRTFEVRISDGSTKELENYVKAGPSDHADGSIVYMLSGGEAERKVLVERALALTQSDSPGSKLVVIAFPQVMSGLEEAVKDLETWLWIRENEPRVAGDRAARQEIEARIDYCRSRIGDLSGRLLGLRGHRHEPQASVWVHEGVTLSFKSAKEFSTWISDLCDSVYHACPSIPNELINRRHLSAAAVAARRNLMQAMMDYQHEANLGLEGGAAEVTMYHAILKASGMHRTIDDKGLFDRPNEEWAALYRAVETFLDSTVGKPKAVSALYEKLSAPPFGLRSGIVPVLLLAFMMTKRHEIAIYEDDVYVPGLRIEVMERLTRQPHRFALQSFRVGKEGTAVLDQIGRMPLFASVAPGVAVNEERLLTIVEPLVRFVAGLKPYAASTKRFRDTRVADVRIKVMRATDPYALIFEELPESFGVDLRAGDEPKEYIDGLANAVMELELAYPSLLAEIEQKVYKAFGLNTSGEEALATLREQAIAIKPWASEPRLKRLAMELNRASTADWREGLGRVVMDGRAPSQWNDADVPQFHVRLALLASDFMRLRELATEHRAADGAQVVRVSLLDGSFEEARAMSTVPAEWEDMLQAKVREIQKMLGNGVVSDAPNNASLRLAVLARALVDEMKGSDG